MEIFRELNQLVGKSSRKRRNILQIITVKCDETLHLSKSADHLSAHGLISKRTDQTVT